MTEIHSGSSGATSRAAAIAALPFSVSKIVSTSRRSTPPSARPGDLLGVGGLDLVEGDAAEGRLVDARRERERDVQRAERPGDEPAARLVRRLPREPRALDVEVVDDVLEPVVGLADPRRRERVRGRDVRAGGEVLPVDVEDDVGPRQVEQVGVAGDLARVVAEALAAVVGSRRARPAGASSPRRRRARRSAAPAAPAIWPLRSPVPPRLPKEGGRGGRRWLFRRFFSWSPSCLQSSPGRSMVPVGAAGTPTRDHPRASDRKPNAG